MKSRVVFTETDAGWRTARLENAHFKSRVMGRPWAPTITFRLEAGLRGREFNNLLSAIIEENGTLAMLLNEILDTVCPAVYEAGIKEGTKKAKKR